MNLITSQCFGPSSPVPSSLANSTATASFQSCGSSMNPSPSTLSSTPSTLIVSIRGIPSCSGFDAVVLFLQGCYLAHGPDGRVYLLHGVEWPDAEPHRSMDLV